MRRIVAGVIGAMIVAAAACADDDGGAADSPSEERAAAAAADGVEADTPVRAGEIPEVEPIAVEVFRREAAPDVGPGRRWLHVMLPPQAEREQVRQALVRTLEEEAERDSTLVAIRLIAYSPRPSGPQRARLEQTAWAEWLPPGGWHDATADSRDRIHRSYTYLGGPPEW